MCQCSFVCFTLGACVSIWCHQQLHLSKFKYITVCLPVSIRRYVSVCWPLTEKHNNCHIFLLVCISPRVPVSFCQRVIRSTVPFKTISAELSKLLNHQMDPLLFFVIYDSKRRVSGFWLLVKQKRLSEDVTLADEIVMSILHIFDIDYWIYD